jgi:hypothetical protein
MALFISSIILHFALKYNLQCERVKEGINVVLCKVTPDMLQKVLLEIAYICNI